ncbi:MAG: 4Fe-4S dicluster domain-containing protein [Truepera sp.]|nr:4Fe-4S dicluster domain-containing protein [Truepera sp.]
MFDRLLNFIVKATNLQPSYTPEHCLVVKRAVGGCTICHDICPHRAITITRQVAIDDIDCTGCGLCVEACPSQALEASVAFQPGAPLKCSQVTGSAQSVQCLARLQPSDLVRLADRQGVVTLVRNDCASCKIGAPAVIEALDRTAKAAQALAALQGVALKVSVQVAQKYDTTDNPKTLSRRELLRGGWRSAQHTASDLVAPLEQFSQGPKETLLPNELRKQLRLLSAAAPQPDTLVPWRLPRIAEGCIMCPVCTNVCPTKAFRREFDPPSEGGGAALLLAPERCNGCNACITSCPVKVITLDDQVSWSELSGGEQVVYRREVGQGLASVPRQTRSG